MSARVSVIVPALADSAALEGLWSALEPELTPGDELVIVDDSGDAVLAAWAERACPSARVVTRDASGGYAAAVRSGAQEATGEVLVVLRPDVRVRPGFLQPLVDALASEEVGVAAPRLFSAEGAVESSCAVQLEDGRLQVQPRDLGADPGRSRPLPFAPSAAFAVRRSDLLAGLGLDELFAPFGWEDVDLGLSTWRLGRAVLEVPASQAERTPSGSLDDRVPDELLRASHEKNRLLALWKYVDAKRDAHDHIASLWRDALDAAIADRREELIWMALALQELPRVDRARRGLRPPARALEQVLRMSDPVG